MGCQKRAVICNFSQSGEKCSHEYEVEGWRRLSSRIFLDDLAVFTPRGPQLSIRVVK